MTASWYGRGRPASRRWHPGGTPSDRDRHLPTEDEDETEERHRERLEHEQIRHDVIQAERAAVILLRDRGEINDEVLRRVERELDLEELRMEA